MTDRLADAIAAAITKSGDGPPSHVARLQAVALAWVFQTITDEAGRLDSLDRWLTSAPVRRA